MNFPLETSFILKWVYSFKNFNGINIGNWNQLKNANEVKTFLDNFKKSFRNIFQNLPINLKYKQIYFLNINIAFKIINCKMCIR